MHTKLDWFEFQSYSIYRVSQNKQDKKIKTIFRRKYVYCNQTTAMYGQINCESLTFTVFHLHRCAIWAPLVTQQTSRQQSSLSQIRCSTSDIMVLFGEGGGHRPVGIRNLALSLLTVASTIQTTRRHTLCLLRFSPRKRMAQTRDSQLSHRKCLSSANPLHVPIRHEDFQSPKSRDYAY